MTKNKIKLLETIVLVMFVLLLAIPPLALSLLHNTSYCFSRHPFMFSFYISWFVFLMLCGMGLIIDILPWCPRCEKMHEYGDPECYAARGLRIMMGLKDPIIHTRKDPYRWGDLIERKQ